MPMYLPESCVERLGSWRQSTNQLGIKPESLSRVWLLEPTFCVFPRVLMYPMFSSFWLQKLYHKLTGCMRMTGHSCKSSDRRGCGRDPEYYQTECRRPPTTWRLVCATFGGLQRGRDVLTKVPTERFMHRVAMRYEVHGFGSWLQAARHCLSIRARPP